MADLNPNSDPQLEGRNPERRNHDRKNHDRKNHDLKNHERKNRERDNRERNNRERNKKEDPWIFRDGSLTLPGEDVFRNLRRSLLSAFENPRDHDLVLAALILSGEIESALADLESPWAQHLSDLTSALADFYLGEDPLHASHLADRLCAASIPSALTISPPEGFSFYALHPMDFAVAAEKIADSTSQVAVIGVRSIGTTLSAVVAAALKRNSVSVDRITLRPTGHPYDRTTALNTEQLRWVDRRRDDAARFLVVDEGPGRSASTFLSVAEALVRAGVPGQRILLMGSVEPNVSSLLAENAATRWPEFQYVKCGPTSYSRFDHCTYTGAGLWRAIFLENPAEWPASWPQMERLKFLSPDGTSIFKFEGLGQAGDKVIESARTLAKAGFGCPVKTASGGFAEYERMAARSPDPRQVSQSVLDRIAHYCAFRASEFRVVNSSPSSLAQMTRFNAQQEFGDGNGDGIGDGIGGGIGVACIDEDALAPEHPVLADARMQPHEWLIPANGLLLKTDAVTHGDDHFFPGPCDIAWDLAGTAVEWDLSYDALEYLLRRFRSRSGVDVSKRIHQFISAYSVFRMAYCKMAAGSVRQTPDEFRLMRAYRYYRSRAETRRAEPGRAEPGAAI